MPEERISETVSEKNGAIEETPVPVEKRRRGRPPVFEAPSNEAAREHFWEVTSERGQRNKQYMTVAIGVIDKLSEKRDFDARRQLDCLLPDGAEFATLSEFSVMREAMKRHLFRKDRKAVKAAILAELGRIAMSARAETMLAIARQLCEMDPKPNTREAITMLRHWRTDNTPPAATLDDLFEAIWKAIDTYGQRHTSMTYSMMTQVLEDVLAWHEWNGEDDPSCVFCGEPAWWSGCMVLAEDKDNSETFSEKKEVSHVDA